MGSEQWSELRGLCKDEEAFQQLQHILRYGPDLPTRQLNDALTQAQYRAEQQAAVAGVIQRIRAPLELDAIFHTTTAEVRRLLQCDRVVLYRFDSTWGGRFIAESVASGWRPLLTAQDRDASLNANISDCSIPRLNLHGSVDTYMQQTQGGRANARTCFVVDDVHAAGFSQCYLSILQRYQVRAYITVPVYRSGQVWGLLAAYQNSGPRHWDSSEVNLATQISGQFSIALQQAEYIAQLKDQSAQLARAAQREQGIIQLIGKLGQTIINRIRQSLDFHQTLQDTIQEIRSFLDADRVAVYRFHPDWSGEFIAESAAPGWTSLLQAQADNLDLSVAASACVLNSIGAMLPLTDTHLQQTQASSLYHRESLVADDIHAAGFSDCYITMLQRLEARAYAIVPIYQAGKLWGLLAAYQNSGPRHWEASEISLLSQIATQLGAALHLAESIRAAQKREQRERVITNIANRIRKSLDISTILTTTTQELRHLLDTDRVAVYKFYPDWSGEFIAEDVKGDWIRLASPGLTTVWQDTEMQRTQGGRYRHGETFAVDDIYGAGHQPCHVKVLEQFQVKAYAIAPIFVGQKLWGLLAAYHNRSSRHWQPADVDLLAQIGIQIGVALQHGELFANLRAEIQERQEAEAVVKALNRELEQSVERLVVVNRELESFSYSVSHDLRAPLRSINGFSRALVEDCAAQLGEEGQLYIQRVRAASQRMGLLIDALLNLSQVSCSNMRQDTVDLGAMAQAIATELQNADPHRQVKFILPDRLIITGDPHLLHILLQNLLDNAWKFTSRHATATIEFSTITQDTDQVLYYVRDDGAGFDMAYADKLFGAFQRLHRAADFPGTGIGLATIQRIVHRHSGRVWAEGAIEQGATFYFTL